MKTISKEKIRMGKKDKVGPTLLLLLLVSVLVLSHGCSMEEEQIKYLTT